MGGSFTLAESCPGPASANETPLLDRTTAFMEEIRQVSGKLQGYFQKGYFINSCSLRSKNTFVCLAVFSRSGREDLTEALGTV